MGAPTRYPFFLPVKVLGRVFRGKFVSGLKRLYRQKRLCFAGQPDIERPKQFASFLRILFRQDWVVYAKPAFGGPAQVLRYLGRYTHRVAISNHRLLEFDGERVTFRWKDYAHGNKQRKMTLPAAEFLRRFVHHILPRGFVRIRQYGFLANRCRTSNISLARLLLASEPMPREPCADKARTPASWLCPRCGTTMQIGPNLTPRQLASRCKYFDSS
jgi:hypothetical protein